MAFYEKRNATRNLPQRGHQRTWPPNTTPSLNQSPSNETNPIMAPSSTPPNPPSANSSSLNSPRIVSQQDEESDAQSEAPAEKRRNNEKTSNVRDAQTQTSPSFGHSNSPEATATVPPTQQDASSQTLPMDVQQIMEPRHGGLSDLYRAHRRAIAKTQMMPFKLQQAQIPNGVDRARRRAIAQSELLLAERQL